jgi:hypothetical protein
VPGRRRLELEFHPWDELKNAWNLPPPPEKKTRLDVLRQTGHPVRMSATQHLETEMLCSGDNVVALGLYPCWGIRNVTQVLCPSKLTTRQYLETGHDCFVPLYYTIIHFFQR